MQINISFKHFYSLSFQCEYDVDFIQHLIKIEFKWYLYTTYSLFFSYFEQNNFHKIKTRKYHQLWTFNVNL